MGRTRPSGAVPKFFFDIHDGELTTDDVGTDLPDLSAARDQAVTVLPDIARDELPDGDERVFQVVVRDEDGKPVFKATMSLRCRFLN